MAPALIEIVVSYLGKDQEKLRDVSITGLTDAVRRVDRLLRAFTILEPIIGLDFGQMGGSVKIVNYHQIFSKDLEFLQ